MDSMVFQYILLALVFIFACYSIFRIIRKNFISKKNGAKDKGCDRGCCS